MNKRQSNNKLYRLNLFRW